MKKRLLLIVICLLLLLTACSPAASSGADGNTDPPATEPSADGGANAEELVIVDAPNDVTPPVEEPTPPVEEPVPPVEVLPGYTLHELTLPSSDAEKTKYNAFVFDHSFSMSLCLPEGWEIREAAAMKEEGLEVFEAVDGIFSIQCILDEDQVPVGAIGYNEAPTNQTESGDPMALFAFITMAKHSFICSESPPFTWLRDDGNFLLAVTEVQYDHPPMENLPCTYNRGILARDEKIGVYVAIELDYDSVDEEQLAYIAQSLVLREV